MTRNSDSRPGFVPDLPTELTDLIIDHLAHDLHDQLIPHRKSYRPHVLAPLVACSSVSKAFHNRTSHHIFSTIILTESSLSGRGLDNPRKQTISGLLDILDNSNDDTFRKRVHTLKLYTAPIRLPAKCAWGDVDEDFPTILKDVYLPRVLHKLTGIRSLHCLHRYPQPFRYSDLSEDMKLGMEAILHGQYLSRLELVGFSELPRSFLACCLSLTKLDYHEYSWWNGIRPAQNIASEKEKKTHLAEDSVLTCHSLSFNLQYAYFTGCNNLVKALIADGAFSNLKTFKLNLSNISDIVTSSKIIQQASSTLETVHINHLNAQLFMGEIKDSPIDFSSSFCLREIAISCFGPVESRLLHAVCKLLTTRSTSLPPIRINGTIEIVKLDIRLGGARIRGASIPFERNNSGWDELDKLLCNSPLFRQLKVVEIRVGMIIEDDEDTSDGRDVCQLRKEISQGINNLFRTLTTTRAVKLSILINYPTLI